MTFWQRFLYWLRPRVMVRRQPVLSERQMNQALADISETHPLWLTIHQLIDTAERNAWDDAAVRMENPQLQAGFVGGARHLDLLRGELARRRQLGKKVEGGGRKTDR